MDSHETITVTEYLLQRLESLGVRHVFGVPGDYNLKLLDSIIDHPTLEWVGTANELGASYAVDGYARMTGFGALVTTFGVGELSAINGVAGSYAERVPLVHLAVGPAQAMERTGAVLHHTAGDGDYERFARAHAEVTCAQAVLRPGNAGAEIDRVLTTALRESRPGYLRLPADVAAARIAAPTDPLPRTEDLDTESLSAFLRAAEKRVAGASSATVLADFLADRFHARDELTEFLAVSGFPVSTLSMGKTVIDEDDPQFVGVYSGQLSDPRTRIAVDEADLLIRVGVLLSDTTSGGFTQGFDLEAGIDIGPYSAAVDGKRFDGVPMRAALSGLTKRIGEVVALPKLRAESAVVSPIERTDAPLTQHDLWDAVAAAVRPWNTVIAEQGTSFFGMCTRRLPGGARFIAQPLWGSIGYTLPALLGAQLADPSRRGLLLIGDGSAQLTIQELGTIARHGLTPVIVLVNNSGYTVERAIHGRRAPYNNIAEWDWAAVPHALGAADALVLRARTSAELARALDEAAQATDRLVFVEVRTDMDDTPPLLTGFADGVGARNSG